MIGRTIQISAVLAASYFSFVAAQDQAKTCYGPGSVVGAVLGTLILTLILSFCFYYIYNAYWKNRRGKHLELMSDTENPNDQYAFDNPCFREATPIKRNIEEEKLTSKLEKNKWLGWTALSFGKEQKKEKVTSMDDSFVTNPELKVVTLKSHDFTGLGFNICGNMRDGIFVKDVLHRGPAFESGCISPGDRINSVCINFRNMVFEDALTILSYASPYDVQIQVENNANWKPSTLLRSKRESNAISSAEKILHPKFNRSQSVFHLNEIGKSHNKKLTHRMDIMMEKNRMNYSLNKSQDHHYISNEYPTIKVSTNHQGKENQKLEKNASAKSSPLSGNKVNSEKIEKETGFSSSKTTSEASPNKLQKFGVKVLPMNVNPRMGIQSVMGPKLIKDFNRNSKEGEQETEFNVKNLSSSKPQEPSEELDEVDENNENVKGMLTKGLQSLKEKLNQNSFVKKMQKDPGKESVVVEGIEELGANAISDVSPSEHLSKSDSSAPKTRPSVSCGVKAYEKNQQNYSQASTILPEEVTKAGIAAQNNRKSGLNLPVDFEDESHFLTRNLSRKNDGFDSDESTEKNSFEILEEEKKPKKSKGKAPPPPSNSAIMTKESKPLASPKNSKPATTPDEILKESEITIEEKVNEPKFTTVDILENSERGNGSNWSILDSDSDTDEKVSFRKNNFESTKIELNSTEVTVHQISPGNCHDEEKEHNRKAASLGDLSKLDSEQPLSVVLERAVSLDLTNGSVQSGKKRKAPLPPPEEFPAVFDDYRKEPRLDASLGVNTFQRRLKKSSDFGTLQDALNESPKSLEMQISENIAPLDLKEAHSNNIQEFSTWLAECRKSKGSQEESTSNNSKATSSTSLISINSTNIKDNERKYDSPQPEYRETNFCFSINGKNYPRMETNEKTFTDLQTGNSSASGTKSKTVVVISQPNSLEPVVLDPQPLPSIQDESNGDIGSKVRETSEGPPLPSDQGVGTRFNHQQLSNEQNESSSKSTETPVPSNPDTLSSPLTSTLTYITEIKVSTSEGLEDKDFSSFHDVQSSPSENGDNDFRDHESQLKWNPAKAKPEFVSNIRQKIEKFDMKPSLSAKTLEASKSVSSDRDILLSEDSHTTMEASKIPIKAMKSETGQRVLATIQSLTAKEQISKKASEDEYAKRVASILSGTGAGQKNPMPSFQGFASSLYFGTPGTCPPKPSKDYSPTRKVPPVVPPRKMESSLSTRFTSPAEPREAGREILFKFSPAPSKSEKPSSFRVNECVETHGDQTITMPSTARITMESKEKNP